MAVIHGRSKRKASGGRFKVHRKKRKHEIGRDPIEIRLGNEKKKTVRTRGGNSKLRLLHTEHANVLNKSDNSYTKLKIQSVKENKANKDFVRRNVVTKGAIIETEKGLAKVTSRPGQDGIVNAVLSE